MKIRYSLSGRRERVMVRVFLRVFSITSILSPEGRRG
jgi:hypothetical protein